MCDIQLSFLIFLIASTSQILSIGSNLSVTLNKSSAITKIGFLVGTKSFQRFFYFLHQKSERRPEENVEWKKDYLNKNICLIKEFAWWKFTLNPRVLACYENSPKSLLSYSSFLQMKAVSSLRRLDNSLRHGSEQESSGEHWLSVELKRWRIWYYFSTAFDF